MIRTGIARSSHHRERMAAVTEGQGRIAITRYAVEEALPPSPEPLASLVRCELETGRTHQIRVHMAYAGHPLLGDPLYGSGFRTKANRLDEGARTALDELGRQALHAAVLGFAHPTTGGHLRFESRLPADMERLLRELRRHADVGAATPGHAGRGGARAHTKTRPAR